MADLDISTRAAALYRAVKDIPSISAVVDAKVAALGQELVDGKNRLEMTSFTVNGQSYSGSTGTTRWDLLLILNLVKWQLDNGAQLSTRGRGVAFC